MIKKIFKIGATFAWWYCITQAIINESVTFAVVSLTFAVLVLNSTMEQHNERAE